MMATLLRFAIAAVRAWTRLYTWRVPRAIAAARRAEIESDLWECQRDPGAGRGLILPFHLLARLVIGIPDDLGWRVEHAGPVDPFLRRSVAVTVSAAAMAGVLWFVVASAVPEPPQLPAAPPIQVRPAGRHPPPPPPPPPCAPPGFETGMNTDCIR